MGKVIATCISEIKGIQKKNVHQVKLIEDFGDVYKRQAQRFRQCKAGAARYNGSLSEAR